MVELTGEVADTFFVASGNLAFINFVTNSSINGEGWTISYEEAIQSEFEADITEVGLGDQVSFSNLSIGEIDSYNWVFEGGVPETSTAQNPTITYSEAIGTFDVELTISNENMSSTTLKENYVTVVEILGINSDDLSVYPNPTSRYLIIKNSDFVYAEVTDLTGKVLLNTVEKTIDLKNISHGMYILNVSDKNRNKFSTRIIKK